MGGFKSVGNDNCAVFADNGDFSGNPVPSVANGLQTNGQLWVGTTALNAGNTHINVGTITSPDASITVGYSSPNITLVAAAAPPPALTITGDTGGALSPTANNWNLLGQDASVASVMDVNGTAPSTFRVENRAWLTQFVVDPSSTVGSRGTYQTIAAALTAASSGQTIFIRPGSYTENLTLKPGVNLTSFSDGQTPNVTIVGTCTLTTAGSVTISGIRLQTNSAAFLAVTGSAASKVILDNCYLLCSNSTGITYSSSDSNSSVILNNCYGDITTTGITLFTSSGTGLFRINYCDLLNTGLSTTKSTGSNGRLHIRYCSIDFAIETTAIDCVFLAEFTEFDTAAITTIAITHAGQTSSAMRLCYVESGTASALSVSSFINCNSTTLNSGNANVVTGAGTVSQCGVALSNSVNGIINSTTTETRYFWTGKYTAKGQPAFLAHLTAPQLNKTGAGTFYTIIFNGEIFDQDSNYNNATGDFTAPITGRYQFNTSVTLIGCTLANEINVTITASNRTIFNAIKRAGSNLDFAYQTNSIVDMDAGDTVHISVSATGEAGDTDDVSGQGAGQPRTYFGGYLVA